MSKISHKKLIFFGNERLVSGLKSTDAPILTGLLERDYDIVAVVANHHDTKSRNSRELEVAEIARQHNIPLLTPKKPMEIYDTLRDFQADAAILVAYGKIIPQKIIDVFPLGIINIHPSLLPKHRGPTPIENAILEGDSASGVSIMQLTAGMDTGPVFAQEAFKIDETDDKFSVFETVKKLSAKMLFDILPYILDAKIAAKPQNDAAASYSKLLEKSDGNLDPRTMTASEAEQKIRAFLGFPKTRISIANHLIIITKAHVSSQQKTPLDVTFSDGAFLSIDELVAPNGKIMDAASFQRGYLR